MIAYKDFVAKDMTGEGFHIGRKIESIDTILESINAWIQQNSIKVLNVESLTPAFSAPPLTIRVWYEK